MFIEKILSSLGLFDSQNIENSSVENKNEDFDNIYSFYSKSFNIIFSSDEEKTN